MSGCRFSLEPINDPMLFFGRERMVREIRDLMTAGPSPDFAILHGAPKIGRTSLLRYLEHRNLELSGTQVRTCLVDLRLWHLMGPAEITRSLAHVLLAAVPEAAPTAEELSGPVLFDEAMRGLSRRTDARLVLLIDRADQLLVPEIRRVVVSLLGMLNDEVPNLGMVLGVGANEQLGGPHALDRTASVADAIREISPLWARARTLVLRGLSHRDARRFLEAAVQGDSPSGPALAPEDLEWILQMAGGHPFLLNRAGLTVCRTNRRGTPLRPGEQARLEGDLVGDLLPMARAIVRRLTADPQGADALCLARELGALPPRPRELEAGPREARKVDLLLGEGVVELQGAAGEPVDDPTAEGARYWMPSRLLRRLMQRAMEAEAPRPSHTAPVAQPPARAWLVVQRETGEPVTISLTDIEERIIERLLRTPQAVVEAGELARAVWDQSAHAGPDGKQRERLKQRLTGLRRKLAPYAAGDPIVNHYGRGYRLADPARFSLNR